MWWAYALGGWLVGLGTALFVMGVLRGGADSE